MGTSPSTIAPAAVLSVFEDRERPGAPLTAPEVAEALDCARRTAHKKLSELADRGDLETKKVGARGRVWWRPASRRDEAESEFGTRPADRERETEERARLRAMRELHAANRRLMHAETREAVCEVAVEAARRILGLSLSGLWLYAPDADRLEPVAWTESGVEEYGEPPPFPLDDSLVGRAYSEGRYRVYDDIRAEDDVYDPETRVRSELILPLGGYGVLNASSPEVGAFDDLDVSLGRVLAANVSAALERADRVAERRARRRELERRRDELETLSRINALVQDTISALVDAATREEIEATVCRRLAASEVYADALVVERRRGPDRVVPRAGAGGEAVEAFAGPDDEGTRAPRVAAAIEDATVRVQSGSGLDGGLPAGVRGATDGDARDLIAAPLAHADTVFGALVVLSPAAVGERERTALETLGRVVGFVITATNNRHLLLGTTAVELEVRVDGRDAWFARAADDLGATVAVEGVVPTGDDRLVEYVAVEDAPGGTDPGDLVAGTPVEDVRVLASEGDRWYLECAVAGDGDGLRAIAEYGATLRTVRATPDGARVTARFPETTSPREALDVVREALPGAELAAKRVVDVSDRAVATVGQEIADRLTDKQAAALRAATHAGYFDAPRRTSAKELAASLGIAPSTLHQHLQAAHRKVLAAVFDDASVA